MEDIAFKSENIAVRRRLENGSRHCVVTFDSYSDAQTLDRPGFGEEFFQKLGVDAVHIIGRQNDWYQYPELLEAAAIVRSFLASRERVISYGSSMGGYAAIRFGGIFGTHLAAAFSPQFSVNPAVAPFERRWLADALRIRFCLEAMSIRFVPRAFIFYDPRDDDRLHVDLFRGHTEVVDIAVPLGGHPCISMLSETDLLRPILLRLLETGESPDNLMSGFRAARLTSPDFFYQLSVRAKRPRAKTLLAERAYKLDPTPALAGHYGLMLAEEKCFEKARNVFNWALAKEPDNLQVLYRYSHMLEAEGDMVGALQQMDRIFLSPRPRSYRGRRDYLAKHLSERWSSNFDLAFGREREPKYQAQDNKRCIWRKAFNRKSLTLTEADPEILATTVPAPPRFIGGMRQHIDSLKRISGEAQDLLLLGDSLAESWPNDSFGDLCVFNFGLAGDRTQHLLWRLLQVPDQAFRVRCALLMIGTNNLINGDSAAAIVAGIRALLNVIIKKAVAKQVVILEIPPLGVDFKFRATDRVGLNEQLRKFGFLTLNIDQEMVDASTNSSPNYASDGVHFSNAGYMLLSRLLRTSVLRATCDDGDLAISL